MTTQDLTLMQAAIQKMRWHETRQKMLAQNIANADTPGYLPKDVAPLNFKDMLGNSASPLSLTAAATDPRHISPGNALTSARKSAAGMQKSSYEPSPSGNAVVLEEQLLKMNQNYTDHRLTTTIYQKNVDMLKAALRSQ
jgi:flagellar basal-body rod protein FlgB